MLIQLIENVGNVASKVVKHEIVVRNSVK